MSLKERFDKDRDTLLNHVNEFLQSDQNKFQILNSNREILNDLVKKGLFSEALENLEILREKETGVDLIKIQSDEATPTLIRDARKCKNPRILKTEGFEMQYLNVARSAIDIVNVENKPNLANQIQQTTLNFFNTFYLENQNLSQEEISINVKTKINSLIDFLEKNGIDKAHKKLNIAKDFQNFNDTHFNIATISEIKDNLEKTHTVVEAEVALKGITEKQKQEYSNRNKNNWFLKMPIWEQKLVDKYLDKITTGNHVIPTQLRQIIGMKNAFEKITGLFDTKQNSLEILHSSKHAGTLVSMSRDEKSKQKITDLNAQQAQEWIGTTKILHANTLNSGNKIVEQLDKDAEIVTRTKTSMQNVGGVHTNTAFNKFRKVVAFNNLDGVKSRLAEVASLLPKEDEIFKKIQTHLKPQNKLTKLFRKPKGNLNELLKLSEEKYNLSKDTIEILKITAELRQDIEKADSFLLRDSDKGNISMEISRKLNYLNNSISCSNDSLFLNIPKHETLTMCASGKDRTGLAEHDQTAGIIAKRLDMSVDYIDIELLKAGHTAGQAGGIHAGGATIGCYGTLPVTSQGFPENRKDALKTIMESTAPNNKIKILKKKHAIDERLEQNLAQETPNMMQDEYYHVNKSISQNKSITSKNQNKNAPVLNENKKMVQDIVLELESKLKFRSNEINSASNHTPNIKKHRNFTRRR